MSVVATKQISAKLFVGTFELRTHLIDHTTEDMADEIIREANLIIDAFCKRNPGTFVTSPRFAFGAVEGDGRKIDLYVMLAGNPNTQMGTVHLKWKRVDGFTEQLVVRRTAQKKQHENLNASFTIGDLKTALSARSVSLNDERNSMLAHHLAYFEQQDRQQPATFTFDLELSEEGITIVAFRDYQRHSSMMAFVH